MTEPTPDPRPLSAEDLRPARPGGYRRLTFDNGRYEEYQAVFVSHPAGEWDRILIARDDGRIAQLLADLINGDAERARHAALVKAVRPFHEGEYHRGVVPNCAVCAVLESEP